MIRIKAYAKINLGLRILRKRNDGYHDIETIFYRVNPFDEIRLQLSSKISFECDDPSLPNDENNLCVKAAKLLQNLAGKDKGVRIVLKKNIPVGAGLGGGSSDAASTLLGLIKLWNLNIKKEKLNELALQLGSDVSYFLHDGIAYATGRGEILEYFSMHIPYWIVLVYPKIHVSTKWAYQSLSQSRLSDNEQPYEKKMSVHTHKQVLLEKINDPLQLQSLIRNDFELIVFTEHKIVANVKESLYKLGAVFAQMSGSGSTVYGFFKMEETAKVAEQLLKEKYEVFITSPTCNYQKDL